MIFQQFHAASSSDTVPSCLVIWRARWHLIQSPKNNKITNNILLQTARKLKRKSYHRSLLSKKIPLALKFQGKEKIQNDDALFW